MSSLLTLSLSLSLSSTHHQLLIPAQTVLYLTQVYINVAERCCLYLSVVFILNVSVA